MKDVNKIILIGRLGADPVQRETKNGVPVVHFSVATSRRLRDDDSASGEGETGGQGPAFPREETQWHRIVAWGRQGENCAQYLKKGHSVFVEGSLRSHKFEGKDGNSRMAFEIHADNVIFLNRTRTTGSRSEGEEAQVMGSQASA